MTLETLFDFSSMIIFYHVRNVIKTCESIETDGKTPQGCEAGNLLYFTQTVAMKIQHLQIQYNENKLF